MGAGHSPAVLESIPASALHPGCYAGLAWLGRPEWVDAGWFGKILRLGGRILDYTDAVDELRSVNQHEVKLYGEVESVAFSPDGAYFIVNYDDGTNELWQAHLATRLANMGLGLNDFYFDLIHDSDNKEPFGWIVVLECSWENSEK